jgi:hypothetical protein
MTWHGFADVLHELSLVRCPASGIPS